MIQFIKKKLNILIIIVITAVLFTGIGVYASSVYYASDISFTPTEENKENGFDATNVEEALNVLYETKGNIKDKFSDIEEGKYWSTGQVNEGSFFSY